MFDKLQKVDWSKKRLAQDSAVEVPSKILALASLDHVERRAAYSWLKAQLLLDGRYLQVNGDISEALLDSLDNDPLPEPGLVAMLAVDLAVDDHINYLSERFAPRVPSLKGAQKKAFEALEKRTKTFCNWLASADEATAAAAAFALGFLRPQSDAWEALNAALQKAKDPTLLATVLIALGMVSDRRPAQLEPFLSDDHPLTVRCAAAVGLSLHDDVPSTKIAELLVATFREPFPGVPWANGRLRAYPTSQLWNRGQAYAETLAAPLSELYRTFTPEDPADRFTLTDATLLAAFPGRKNKAKSPPTREELTEPQRMVLNKLRELKMNTAMLQDLGLPLLEGLGVLLDAPTQLDRSIRVRMDAQLIELPLWKALTNFKSIPAEELTASLTEQVPPAELFELLKDVCSTTQKIPVLRTPTILECLEHLGTAAYEPARQLLTELIAQTQTYRPQLALLALWPLVLENKIVLGKEHAGPIRQAKGILGAELFMPRLITQASPEALELAEVDVSRYQ